METTEELVKSLTKEERQEIKKEKNRIRAKKYYHANKETVRLKAKQYRHDNKDLVTAQKKAEYEKNKEKYKESGKVYRLKNKEAKARTDKEYYLKNKEKISKYKKQWALKNSEELKVYKRNWAYNKSKTNIQYKLSNIIRSRLRSALRCANIKNTSYKHIKYLGCSIEQLKKHIESQFDNTMSWENYTKDTWHIDHILPLSKFDLSKEEDLKIVCHYLNLRPLSATENFIKYNKMPENASQIKELIIETINLKT